MANRVDEPVTEIVEAIGSRIHPAPHAAGLEGYGVARVRPSVDGGPVVVPPKIATPAAR
jgi:hypothetical protein